MLIGILSSRVFSGVIGNYFGWKSIYIIAAVLVGILDIVLLKALPETKVNAVMTYAESPVPYLHLLQEKCQIKKEPDSPC